jgi:Domain of unknown function (DUF4062)
MVDECRARWASSIRRWNVSRVELRCVVRVFLSSTLTDLEAEREIAYFALTLAGHEVVRMEDFGSNTLASWKLCVKKLDSCQAYVLLVGRTYGSPLLDTGLSYTHAEYERAHILGLPVVAFIKAGQPDQDQDGNALRLREFVEIVNDEHQVRRPYFTVKELGHAVIDGVADVVGPPVAPTFHRTRRALADPEQYAVARAEYDLLEGAPYSVVIADLHVLDSLKYPDDVTVRLRNKALQLRADLLHSGIDGKIFNEIEEQGSGQADILAKRIASAHRSNALVVLIQQRGDLPLFSEHFATFSGTLVVCYPSRMEEPTVSADTRLLRYTADELESCNLVAEVHKALAVGVDEYVLSIAA